MSTDPKSQFDSYGRNFTTVRNNTYAYIDPRKANLKGRNVLVTGASRGIGKAIAISYAQAGASGIALAARGDLSATVSAVTDAATNAGRPAPHVVQLKADVSSRDDIESAAKIVATELGHLDILIANAGILEPIVKIIDSDPDDWKKTSDVNLFGVYLTLKYFLPLVIKSPNPLKTVVGVSSVGATVMLPGFSSYQVGKFALCRLMEFVNTEYGTPEDGGVLALSFDPGAVFTDMGNSAPKWMQDIMNDPPELAADTTVWLTSERREWTKGRFIKCNWDMQELEAKIPAIEERDLLKFRLAMGHEQA